MLMLCLAPVLSACARLGADTRVVFTTGVHGEDVFRIGESVCKKQEMLVYLANAGSKYTESLGVVSAVTEEEIKEYCLALVSQIKAMNLMAVSYEIALDETDMQHAAAAATAYMASLSEEARAALDDISEKELETLYQELALADKVYAYTIRDVNPEISDDEARTVTLEIIFVSKNRADGEGEKRIREAKERIDGGEDFATLTDVYNEAPEARVSFGRGETGDIPEEAAFNLETGKVSEIIETDQGYYLLRSVSSFDREQTRANKEVLLEERRKEAFAKLYNEFAKDLPVELNEELWEKMAIPSGVQSAEYWKYYEVFFSS